MPTAFDSAIPFDAAIPFDGVLTTPQVRTLAGLYSTARTLPGSLLMPAYFMDQWWRGESYAYKSQGPVLNADGSIKDLTGLTLAYTVRDVIGGNILFTGTPTPDAGTGGTWSGLNVTDANTLSVPAGSWIYDLWVTTPGSEAMLTYGQLVVYGTDRYG